MNEIMRTDLEKQQEGKVLADLESVVLGLKSNSIEILDDFSISME